MLAVVRPAKIAVRPELHEGSAIERALTDLECTIWLGRGIQRQEAGGEQPCKGRPAP